MVTTGFGLEMPSPVIILPPIEPQPTRKTKAPGRANLIRLIGMFSAPLGVDPFLLTVKLNSTSDRG